MKNTTLAIAILSALALAGCGQADRVSAAITGYSISCVKGVNYIQFTSGVTVQYNQDGTISTCED